ncbi:hypothetical protein SETIT_1G134100v2 [Setaria italica]|uniref:Uncharacterized protein n=1 Tax=Setaria italica TaxID=4555 RepID=A0A368PK95_SETIT|nr:hypothetical protein SETIT_1G134100v2 [Setaria italica]
MLFVDWDWHVELQASDPSFYDEVTAISRMLEPSSQTHVMVGMQLIGFSRSKCSSSSRWESALSFILGRTRLRRQRSMIAETTGSTCSLELQCNLFYFHGCLHKGLDVIFLLSF